MDLSLNKPKTIKILFAKEVYKIVKHRANIEPRALERFQIPKCLSFLSLPHAFVFGLQLIN